MGLIVLALYVGIVMGIGYAYVHFKGTSTLNDKEKLPDKQFSDDIEMRVGLLFEIYSLSDKAECWWFRRIAFPGSEPAPKSVCNLATETTRARRSQAYLTSLPAPATGIVAGGELTALSTTMRNSRDADKETYK